MAPGIGQVIVELARAFMARHLLVHADRFDGNSSFGVSADEVAAAVSEPRAARTQEAANAASTPEALDRAEQRVAAATADLVAALAASPKPQLGRLADTLGLSSLDVILVALLLAPELDHSLERMFTFALDDFTRKRPYVGFMARFVGGHDDVLADSVLRRFDDAAPLRRYGVVQIDAAAGVPASMRTIRLADRVIAFVRGHDTVDELVRGFVRLPTRTPQLSEIVMKAELVDGIRRVLAADGAPHLLLAGAEGSGRALVTEALLATMQRTAIRIDLTAIANQNDVSLRLATALREAALRDAAAILEGAGLTEDVPRALRHAIADGARSLAIPLVFTLAGHPSWLVEELPDLVEMDVPLPTFRERIELWRQALPPPLATDADLEVVAGRYAFTAGTIHRVARRAAQTARLRNPSAVCASLDDLGEAARLTFSHQLGGMAQRIPTGFAWEDLVLPPETLDAVLEVVRFAHHRPFLLEEWGFAAKLPYGRGVSAILSGPPGTGKTMVAQLLAKELGYDLYRIDLSQIVNQYIGETEKNLAKIFNEAESSHAVLFFDEADALFAKRTAVRSSNDRYANLEVNYLLQRMETFDGVTLLATNAEQGLDEAFKRRVRFSIQFELPQAEERQQLWRSMFPSRVPLANDIDWMLVATRFEMAGGYIKKAALRAALVAVEERRPITTKDLLDAASHEYREMGRIV